MEEESKRKSEEKESKHKFCPLCSKNPNEDDFELTTIGVMDKMECKIEICSICRVVLHNARRIFMEAMRKYKEQKSAIILPGQNVQIPTFVAPKGLVGNGKGKVT